MKSTILVGPILGFEEGNIYTVCLLTRKSVNQVSLTIDDQKVDVEKIGSTVSGIFWRAEKKLNLTAQSRFITYSIELDGKPSSDKNNRDSWLFYVPGSDEQPKFAYTSCNGFSNEGLKENTSDPYYLWNKMAQQHASSPFSLLLMGGDQLYADGIWGETKLSDWADSSRRIKVKKKRTKDMERQIDKFYDKLYQTRWSSPDMSLMLASIPSVMMWDDHDIFDGWGSYPQDIQECDVYQCIFSYAKKYFELYQIRSKRNHNLINKDASHYALSFSFREHHIMVVDNRSERTLLQVMSRTQWNDIITSLKKTQAGHDLLFLTAVPVVYRDFSLLKACLNLHPGKRS